MKQYIKMFGAALALAVVIVAAAITVNGKLSQKYSATVAKKAIGSELPAAVFSSETGERFDLKSAVHSAERTWIVPVFYKCPGACTLVIEKVLDRVNASPDLKAALGHGFQIVFFSFDPSEEFSLAQAKRQFAFERKSISDPVAQNAVRFLSGGGSSAEMITRALNFKYTWNEQSKIYNHDLKYFEVNANGLVEGEVSLNELNAITVAETK